MAKIVPPSTLIRYSTPLIFIYVVFAILSTELHAHMTQMASISNDMKNHQEGEKVMYFLVHLYVSCATSLTGER